MVGNAYLCGALHIEAKKNQRTDNSTDSTICVVFGNRFLVPVQAVNAPAASIGVTQRVGEEPFLFPATTRIYYALH
jgi:hypothetical protein